jgi:hypothetical protein
VSIGVGVMMASQGNQRSLAEHRLVMIVRDAAVARGITFDDALGVVGDEVAAFEVPTEDHAIPWNARAWCTAEWWDERTRAHVQGLASDLNGGEIDLPEQLQISRADVFNRLDGDDFDLFIATMAWGFGTTGYGCWRTAKITNDSGQDRVRASVGLLRKLGATGSMAELWRTWSFGGRAKLRGLDTAFASKVAYFGGFDRGTGSGPLIADLNTSWSLWALTGAWDSRASAENYEWYVRWAARCATELNCRQDDVERALFQLGPRVRRAHADMANAT